MADGNIVSRATIVIVNWNGAQLLPACLDGVARQRASFRFETWVVDNGSRDESVALLRQRYPWVCVLQAGANRGFAGGNNLALRQVTTPFAVLLNNDAVPAADWLARLLAPFDEPGNTHLAAVTGKVLFLPRYVRLQLTVSGDNGVRVRSLLANGRETLGGVLWERLTYGAEGPPGGRFFRTRATGELFVPVPETGPVALAIGWDAAGPTSSTLVWDGGATTFPVDARRTTATLLLPAGVPRLDVINNAGGVVLTDGYGADRGYQQADDGRFDTPEEVFAACGNGVALRTEAGRALGWFDEDFFLYYEDTDLSWRLRSRGLRIRYEPRALLRHVHSATTDEWSPLHAFHFNRNRLLMLTKNATADLAAREVLRYPLTTASMAVRSTVHAFAARRLPPMRPTLLRLRAFGSYLTLLGRMLQRRREVGRTAVVPRRELQRWLTPRPVPALPPAVEHAPAA